VDLKINTSGGAPIYLQIVDEVKRSVALGRLKPEDPLPSVRQLALELTINPNTVARAYLELEHQGFLYKRQGQGTYVCTPPLGAARRERNKIVAGLLEKAIVEAVSFGMSASEITAIYDQLMQRYEMEAV
jgi:GntR family transcriptional regulator